MMRIDINCDVGEGIPNEHLLMQYISSCNIACGGHFGDVNSIDKTIQLAIKNNVLIGAHPSFPDKKNFGRKMIHISDYDFQKSIKTQLDLFLERLSKVHVNLHHIKPHGALYNLISEDKKAAINFITIIKKYMENVFLYVPYNSVIEEVAIKNNIKIKYEAFIDRNYMNTLKLVPRNNENAFISKPKEVLNHLLKMVYDGKVKTISGIETNIKATTFCVHGDHKNTLEILSYLSKELSKKEIHIA